MFRLFFGAFTINLFEPLVLFNDRFYDPVDVRIPAGYILKPKKPDALFCCTHQLERTVALTGGFLGQRTLNAARYPDGPLFMHSGFDRIGKWFQLFQY